MKESDEVNNVSLLLVFSYTELVVNNYQEWKTIYNVVAKINGAVATSYTYDDDKCQKRGHPVEP